MEYDYKLVRLAAITFFGLVTLLAVIYGYAGYLHQECVAANATRPGLEVLAICRGIK